MNNINIQSLSYEERLKLLKDLFDNTHIVLSGAYSVISEIDSDNITFASNEFKYYRGYNESIKIIRIDTEICTG